MNVHKRQCQLGQELHLLNGPAFARVLVISVVDARHVSTKQQEAEENENRQLKMKIYLEQI